MTGFGGGTTRRASFFPGADTIRINFILQELVRSLVQGFRTVRWRTRVIGQLQ